MGPSRTGVGVRPAPQVPLNALDIDTVGQSGTSIYSGGAIFYGYNGDDLAGPGGVTETARWWGAVFTPLESLIDVRLICHITEHSFEDGAIFVQPGASEWKDATDHISPVGRVSEVPIAVGKQVGGWHRVWRSSTVGSTGLNLVRLEVWEDNVAEHPYRLGLPFAQVQIRQVVDDAVFATYYNHHRHSSEQH